MGVSFGWRGDALDAASFAVAAAAGAICVALLPLPQALLGTGFGILAVRIALEDLRTMVVPDLELVALLALGVLAAVVDAASRERSSLLLVQTVRDGVAQVVVLGGAAYLLAFAYRMARGRDGLGLGDIKLLAVAGVWMPVETACQALAGSAMSALAVLAVTAMVEGRVPSGARPIPFAAFLAPALWLFWLVDAAWQS